MNRVVLPLKTRTQVKQNNSLSTQCTKYKSELTNPRQHGDTLCTAAGRVPGYARWLSWSKADPSTLSALVYACFGYKAQ